MNNQTDKASPPMYKNPVVVLIVLICTLPACRTPPVAYASRNITVVDSLNTLYTADCTRLGTVTGQSKLTRSRAVTDSLNNAGQWVGADTMVIANEGVNFKEFWIEGVVFNCTKRRAQPAQSSPQPAGVTKDQFDRAKKCQAKGGVWLNDQCVVDVE